MRYHPLSQLSSVCLRSACVQRAHFISYFINATVSVGFGGFMWRSGATVSTELRCAPASIKGTCSSM
jgi:hypothetical protein